MFVMKAVFPLAPGAGGRCGQAGSLLVQVATKAALNFAPWYKPDCCVGGGVAQWVERRDSRAKRPEVRTPSGALEQFVSVFLSQKCCADSLSIPVWITYAR